MKTKMKNPHRKLMLRNGRCYENVAILIPYAELFVDGKDPV